MVRTLLLSVCPSPEPRLLTFSDQKILGRIPRYSLALRCYSVMNEITAAPVVNESETPPKLSESEKAHRICSGVKVVCTVAVAVLAAGRTGPAAPGSERADRLHLLHVRCTALPARCLRACMVHSAICHTTHVRTGFGREHRQRAFTLDEQRLHVRAVMTCLEAHHDVAIRSGLVAVHSVDRRAVNICNILLQTARLRVLTCCASCAVLDHGCLQQGAPGQRRQVTSARGCTCSMTVHGTASAAHM